MALDSLPRLTPKISPWLQDILAVPANLLRELRQHGSPCNIVHPSSILGNIESFQQSFQETEVNGKVFYARKACRSSALVREAHGAGVSIDVASVSELTATRNLGIPAEDILCTAPFKNSELLHLCLSHEIELVVDSLEEGDLLFSLASERKRVPRVKIRLSDFQYRGKTLFSRFGISIRYLDEVRERLRSQRWNPVSIQGLHFHLDGYSIPERVFALTQCFEIADSLLPFGVHIRNLDIGGGITISYLSSAEEWEGFLTYFERSLEQGSEYTYRNNALGSERASDSERTAPTLYPFWGESVKDVFLREILCARAESGLPLSRILRERQLELHCEPGRALIDQCGATVAQVLGVKRDGRGNVLVGLDMNASQLKSPSHEYCLDPFFICQKALSGDQRQGFLVGNMCMEQDLILKRRIALPSELSEGDLVLFWNTAGYFMHLFDSPGHRPEIAQTILYSSEEKSFFPE